jgi:predicted choloylglycine hydrolase
MSKLLWFNKEGDALNINYDQTSDLYSGTLFFDQNSSDTYKTIGLYLFENIDSFEFDSNDGDLGLQKFQLFNENRFTFTGNSYFTQSITSIEPVNNRSDFYSKWIYGLDFEKKYPIGTCIIFDSPIFEFSSSNYTYVVVSTKKNAIMIISAMDNLTFTNTYVGLTFSNKSISGLNSIGIYDYRRG